MLELDSPRWAKLRHAYGGASDIPAMLLLLEAVTHAPPTLSQKNRDAGSEPWFSLWSALCHQGDVYTASYAALPHIVRIGRGAQQDHWQFFLLAGGIQNGYLASQGMAGAMVQRGHEMPADLSDDYAAGLRALHDFAYKLADREWDDLLSRSIAYALLASKGHALVAEAVINLSPQNTAEFVSRVVWGEGED